MAFRSQQVTVRQAPGRACCTHPGSQASSSLAMRARGNHGDPSGSVEGAAQPRTSLNNEEEAESVGKSELPIVAMKSGNSDGAKAWAGKWMHEDQVEGLTTGVSV